MRVRLTRRWCMWKMLLSQTRDGRCAHKYAKSDGRLHLYNASIPDISRHPYMIHTPNVCYVSLFGWIVGVVVVACDIALSLAMLSIIRVRSLTRPQFCIYTWGEVRLKRTRATTSVSSLLVFLELVSICVCMCKLGLVYTKKRQKKALIHSISLLPMLVKHVTHILLK